MSIANHITPKKPIGQAGKYGYLLWVRRDLAPVYSALIRQFPDVATFEAALRRQAQGLGDDFVIPDITVSAPAYDVPIVDFSADLSIPTFTASDSVLPSFDLPTVAIPPDVSGAAGQVASNISPSTFSDIGRAVTAILPTAIKAAGTVGAAVINAQTASKAQQTAQIQYAAAAAGRSPYQTGVIRTGSGSLYLAPIGPYSGASGMIAGVPLYWWLIGGVGVLAVLLASRESL
jgi:hypothetical protein